MFQDWTWGCQGCGKIIKPYESHDMEKCYAEHGVKPYQSPPTTVSDRIFGVALLLAYLWFVFWLLT